MRKTYGVLGFPVKHSFSPAMHNAALRHLHLDAEYLYFEKSPDQVGLFLSSLAKEGISGLNVTVPHKERVIPFLSGISSEAGLIGAVNTISVIDEKLEGFNTDGAGFLKHLQEDLKFQPQGKTVVVIGCGGAARAITVYLAKSGAGKISLFDIDTVKKDALLKTLENNFKDTVFCSADAIEGLGISEADLLVNATPQGMKEGDPLPVPKKLLHDRLLAYDLIYNPQETMFLREARQTGARTANGLGMLLYQGALSFEIWTGIKAPVEIMRKALREVVYK